VDVCPFVFFFFFFLFDLKIENVKKNVLSGLSGNADEMFQRPVLLSEKNTGWVL